MKYCLPKATSASFPILIAATLIITTVKKDTIMVGSSVNICKYTSAFNSLYYATSSQCKIYFHLSIFKSIDCSSFPFETTRQILSSFPVQGLRLFILGLLFRQHRLQLVIHAICNSAVAMGVPRYQIHKIDQITHNKKETFQKKLCITNSWPCSTFYAARLNSRIVHDMRPQMPPVKKKLIFKCTPNSYWSFPFFISVKVEMCFSEIRICVCMWENGGTKNIP